MPKESNGKRIAILLQSYLRTLRMLSVRVRALETMLEYVQPDFRERYLRLVASLEFQRSQPGPAQEWSELDEIIVLLTSLINEKPPTKKK